MSRTHRCEAKDFGQVKAYHQPTGQRMAGALTRTTRCQSRETVLHVRNEKAADIWARKDAYATDRHEPLVTEAWFCAEHIHDQRRGQTVWIPA